MPLPQIKLDSPVDFPTVSIRRTWEGALYCLEGESVLAVKSPLVSIPLTETPPCSEYLEMAAGALKSASGIPWGGDDEDTPESEVYELVVKGTKGTWYGWVAIPKGEDPDIVWDAPLQAQHGTVSEV